MDRSALRAQPPRALVVIAFFVLIVSTVLTFVGAWTTGIAWDETYHVMRFGNYTETGWYALDRDFGADGPGADGTTTYVYGPVTMLLLQGWSALFGFDPGNASTSVDAYAVRHLGVAVIGAAGTAATAVITRIITASWRWGLVAAALLSAVPLWAGQSMFNIKDVPVATGITLVTLGLVHLTYRPEARSTHRVGRVVVLVAGAVLAIGTRPGIWVAVGACVGVYLLLTVVRAWPERRTVPRRLVAPAGELAAAGVVSAALLVLAYPKAFGSPWTTLQRAAESSAQFRGGAQSDRGYIVEQSLLQIPGLLLILFLIGSVVAVRVARRGVRSTPPTGIAVAVLLAQEYTLPVLAVIAGSDLYNGLRQLLFVLPAGAVLATLGICWTCSRLLGVARWNVLVAAGLGLVLITPTAAQATLFPYQYTYASGFADFYDLDPETDYWRTSYRALVPAIPTDGLVICSPFQLDGARAYRYSFDGNVDCRRDSIGPVAPHWRARNEPLGDTLPVDEFYALLERGIDVPSNCEQLDAVTRWRHGRTVVMGRLARCLLPFEALPEGGLPLDGELAGWLAAIQGWNPHATREGLTTRGVAADLGFKPPQCPSGCSLELTGRFPADLVATAAGQTLPVVRTSTGVRIALPSADDVSDHGVRLRLTRSSDEELGAAVTRLELAR